MQDSNARKWWGIAFTAYAVLSLSSMAGMSIGLGIFGAGTLWFLWSDWQRGAKSILREAFATPFSWVSAALFLACLLSLVAAVVFPVEGSIEGPRFSSLKKFHYYIFPPLFAAALLHAAPVGRRMERHAFWVAWFIMAALMGAVAVVQYFGADLFPAHWLENAFFRRNGSSGRFHGQGLMFFHLSFTSSMCFAAAAAWARLLFPLPREAARSRWLWLGVAILCSLGVFYSYSRTGFVALGLMLVVLGFLKRPLWGLFATVAVAILAAGLWFGSETLHRRWQDNQSGNRERFVLWAASWEMLKDRPLTGIGFSRTGELSPHYVKNVLKHWSSFTSHAHNNFLDMMAATGALGLLAYLAWWAFLMWAAFSAFRRGPPGERWLPAAAFTGFVGFHINGLTQVNYWDGKSEHTLMVWAGVAVAIWIRARSRKVA